MNGYQRDLEDIERLNDYISRLEITLDACMTGETDEATLIIGVKDLAEIIRLMKSQRELKKAIAKTRKE